MRKRKRQEAEFDEGLLAGARAGAAGTDAEGQAEPAPAAPEAGEISMGMSLDYEVAVEEGATMVRVGTALFGPRPTTA